MKRVEQPVEMPRSHKERLDDLEIGTSILIRDDKEYYNFNTVRHRDFAETEKVFTIRTDKTSKERRIWRLK